MQTFTLVHPLPSETHPAAAAALRNLIALRSDLDAELAALPEPPSCAPDETLEEPAIAELVQRVGDYWSSTSLTGESRYQKFCSAMRQALWDEVHLKVHERDLEPRHIACLPAPSDAIGPDLTACGLYLQLADDEETQISGALCLIHEQGQVLLTLPGAGAIGFASLTEMRVTLAHWLNSPTLKHVLLNAIAQPHRDRLEAIDQDPDVYPEPYTTADFRLPDIQVAPFRHMLHSLLNKQLEDLRYACCQSGHGDSEGRGRQIKAAIDMDGLLGPSAMLELRERHCRQRRERQNLPDWIKFADRQQLDAYTEQVRHYDRTLATVLSVLGAAASPEHFAAAHVRRRLADDLGLDLDPTQVSISTRRTLPLTGETCTTVRTLVELALYGLHPDDLIPGSDFLNQTTLSLSGEVPESERSLPSVGYIAQLVDELDLRVRFGEYQRTAYDNPEHRRLIALLVRTRITTQAFAAKMQGHIRPADFSIIEAADTARSAASPAPGIQQIRLAGRYTMGKLLVFCGNDEQGRLQRLVMVAADAPLSQRFKAFDNPRQLDHELLGWLSSDAMRDYLLSQVEVSDRAELGQRLAALKLKPYPESGFIQRVDLSDYEAGLQAFVEEHVRVALSEQARHTPDWYLQASRDQRRELLALEDAAAGALRNYNARPHTRVQPFEQYAHERASLQIARLLELPVGEVDPDHIIIYSERETVSYTDMLLNGYDDSLGLSRTAADTHAKFSGPAGVDLSKLTPERVTGSVRGKWLGDDYIALVKSTLLDADSSGYAYRRQTSLLITQLNMQAAALRSLLKGHISEQQYQWLRDAVDRAHLSDHYSRERYPLYPLQIHVDKPFIGSQLSGVDQLVIPDTRLTHVETVQGCIAVLPTQIRQAALLYTPQAPDGIEFRLFGSFSDSLHAPGMLDYYKARCRTRSHKTLALFLADMRNGNASKAPFLPKDAITDFADTCFNRPILRRLRDVEETTTGRSELLTRLVWTTVEIIASVVTLPFPPASFAVGLMLSMHDSVRALNALRDGETEAASVYALSSMLNSLGAAGDLHSGVKGFGGPLKQIAARQRAEPLAGALQPPPSLPRYEELFPVELQDEWFLVEKPNVHGHAPVYRSVGSRDVDATGEFAIYRPGGKWDTLGAGSGMTPSATSSLAVDLPLNGTAPVKDGHAKGVWLVDGQPCIELSGKTYRVQYDARLRCWQIFDPANPFAFFGKQPVRLDKHGQWELIERPQLRGGMDDAGTYRPLAEDDAGSSAAMGLTSDYELPQSMQKHLHIILDTDPYDPSGYGLESYFETYFGKMRQVFTLRRERIYHDADAFFMQPHVPPRPPLPALLPPVTLETWFKNIFTHSNGLVLSEAPRSVASKRLLILNMPLLAEQRVEVLYIEHLFTDRHLPKLAQYRALGSKSRAGSHEIKYHFKDLNGGALDNQTSEYDYYHLVKAAHRHGIEIRPLSSSISYPLIAHPVATAVDDPIGVQKISKFFGHKVISGDRALDPSRRWIALVDQKLATTCDDLPGIAELQGVTSAHIQDLPAGRPTRVTAGTAGQTAEAGAPSDYLIGFANPLILSPSPLLPPSTLLDDALFKVLADSEAVAAGERWAGDYGFAWDEVGGWVRIEPQEWSMAHPPTAIQQSLADAAYDTPVADRSIMHTLANFQGKGLDQQYFILDAEMGRVRSTFFTRRRKLQTDAQSIISTELPPRPTLPAVEPHASLPAFLSELYQHTDGLIIGEAHSSIASKKLIIDHLPLLSQQKVKTLYMEHLLTDLHQADLDRFAETGHMSKTLLHDLRHLDRGHHTDPDGVYTFERLVIRAQQQGLEIRAIDCTASYHLKGLLNKAETSRQQMMNYFASRTIARHQEVIGSHKWIALVGNSHCNTFGLVVPGIAELQGGIGLRVIDVLPGKSTGITPDPGELLPQGMTRQTAQVRADFRVEMEVNRPATIIRPPQPLPLEERLVRPGMFLIEQGEGDLQTVVHRSRDMRILHTPVQVSEHGKLFVERPSWTSVHLTSFDDMDALIAALQSINLTRVG